VEKDKHIPRATLELGAGGKERRFVWGRKEEEFVADFELVAKRTLKGQEWDIFRFHFLLGADWRLCCQKMKIDRGTFFHAVYRIEQRLGRTFRDLQPYALFPLDEYFGGVVRRGPTMAHYQGHAYDDPLPDSPLWQQRPAKVVPVRAPINRRPKVGPPEEKAA
jgi:hypothetical protein